MSRKSIARALLSNPGVRRAIVKNVRKAVSSASTSLSSRGGPAGTKAPGTPGPTGRSVLDPAGVKKLVTTVAKPVAEQLASTDAGRSVLRTISEISSEALGEKDKRPDRPLNAFMNRLAEARAAAAAPATPKPAEPRVNFTPLQPPPPPSSADQVVKWPPPRIRSAVDPGDAGSPRE